MKALKPDVLTKPDDHQHGDGGIKYWLQLEEHY
jgi:hypothetical protein